MSTTPSKKKSEAILEAIMLWSECRKIAPEEDGSWQNPNRSYKAFYEKLENAGWKNANMDHCDGSFKQCFYKGSIIVKFPKYSVSYSKNEIQREYEQWAAAPNNVKKYLAKTYCLIDLVLIQDKVLIRCRDKKFECKIDELKKKYIMLGDYVHNHGHSKSGTIKFFDWVYNRNGDHLDNPDKRLYA